MANNLLNKKKVGRLAPSPSGKMHLGNAFTYILAWAAARKCDGKLIFRVEDIDDRCKRQELHKAIINDMRWLGIEWDGEIACQSKRTHIYDEIFGEIKEGDLTYPCFCSRADLHVVTAPHTTDGHLIYSGKCKHLSCEEIANQSKHKNPSTRIKVPDVTISITDDICGKYSQNLTKECGDFVIKRSDGIYAYQFAVSVDDYLQGINQIVRGNDLLSSTPRQEFLKDVTTSITTKFDNAKTKISRVEYAHVPLLTDARGRRLAKRDKDLTIESLRAQGSSPSDIIGYFAHILGFIESYESVKLVEFLDLFDITKIPNQNIAVDYALFQKH